MIGLSDKHLDWLQLPPPDRVCSSPHIYYGATKVAAAYCGLRWTPKYLKGYWTHGWIPKHLFVDPRVVGHAGTAIHNRSKLIWTGRQDEADYLVAHGFEARAIGLPITYVPERFYQRRARTLLVMPAHSLHYTQHQWHFQEYAETIRTIRDDFEDVVVCLHSCCVENGYWVNEFRDLGFPVIIGADPFDQNSLSRIRALMSQVEFVTTNGYGSHLAYAAAFGAKVSIYGQFCETRSEDFDEDPYYQENPDLLDKLIPLVSEEGVKNAFPFFFCHPAAAIERGDWGTQQIGSDCRQLPRELRTLFGWNWASRAFGDSPRRLYFLGCRLFPDAIKKPIKAILDPSWANERREMKRLEEYPRRMAGSARLRGEQFEFCDAQRFIQSWKRVFDEQVFDFPCFSRNPLIIEVGAGIGLAIRYWFKQYPEARIVAIESDPDLFAILKRNCAGHTKRDLRLFNSLNMNRSGVASSQSHPSRTGGFCRLDNASNPTTPMPRVDLRQLLDNPVDFVRIGSEQTPIELLESCSSELPNVRRMCIEYRSSHGSKQDLGALLEILTSAGFRYYIAPIGPAWANPFIVIRAADGFDMQLTVWAYRGRKFPRAMAVHT
jgi:FkbM family methyltransferase